MHETGKIWGATVEVQRKICFSQVLQEGLWEGMPFELMGHPGGTGGECLRLRAWPPVTAGRAGDSDT